MREDKILKQFRTTSILQAVIFIVAGIALIAKPVQMGNLLGFILGALCFGLGIYRLVVYFRHQRLEALLDTELFWGIGLAVLGFICLLYHNQVLTYVTVIFGIFLIAGSVIKVQNSIILLRLDDPNWWIGLILGLVSVVFAVMVILKPKFIADIFLVVAGWFILYDGISSLAVVIMSGMFIKKLKNGYVPPVPHAPKPDFTAAGPDEKKEHHGFFHFHKKEEAAEEAAAPYQNMSGVPEPEQPAKKKKGFSLFGFGKKKEESAETEPQTEIPQETVIKPAASDVQDAAYHPLNTDPFSSAPSNDASMEGVSFDAAPGSEGAPAHEAAAAAETETPYANPLPELKPDPADPSSDTMPELKPDPVDPSADGMPELKPDPVDPSADSMPELIPDPVAPGEEMPQMNFDPDTGEPLHN